MGMVCALSAVLACFLCSVVMSDCFCTVIVTCSLSLWVCWLHCGNCNLLARPCSCKYIPYDACRQYRIIDTKLVILVLLATSEAVLLILVVPVL